MLKSLEDYSWIPVPRVSQWMALSVEVKMAAESSNFLPLLPPLFPCKDCSRTVRDKPKVH